MKEELLKGLSKEQIDKVKACKNQEELLKLAKEEGVELSDEQLATVNGGFCSTRTMTYPQCGSNNVSVSKSRSSTIRITYYCTCKNCGHKWSC